MYRNRLEKYFAAMEQKKAPAGLTFNEAFKRKIVPLIEKKLADIDIDALAELAGVSRKSIENYREGFIPSKNKSRQFNSLMVFLDLNPVAAKRGEVKKLEGPPTEDIARLIADMRQLPNWSKIAEHIEGIHAIALGAGRKPTS